jgi:hypothetical protein
MRRIQQPSPFVIVPSQDALALTGLNVDELQASPQVQLLTRVSADGSREPAFRVPRDLLLDADTED